MNAKNIVPHARKTVIAGLLLAGLAGTAAAETVRYHSNGERACMYGYLDTTALSLCVYTNKLVGQGDDNRPVSAFLTYYAHGLDSFSSGFGQIPVSAIQIRNGEAVLSINPYGLPEFASSGPLSGHISLVWTVDGLSRTRFHNNSQSVYGNIRQIYNGGGTADSARVTGTVFGYGLTGASGSIGESRDLTIVIMK